MFKLFCVVVGEGRPFPVDVAADETAGDLKDKIKEKKMYQFPADELQLYLALKDGAWIGSKSSIVRAMKKGEVRDTVKELIQEEMELDPADTIGVCFVGEQEEKKPEIGTRQIHVLVVVPEEFHPSKKQRQDVGLYELCRISSKVMADITQFPDVNELPAFLLQSLPFRLQILDTALAQELFTLDAPQIKCDEMMSLINMINTKCNFNSAPTALASENTWQSYYDVFLMIIQMICSANQFRIDCTRNKVDATGTTTGNLRPDCLICTKNGLVVLRGEEKNATTGIDVPLTELTAKMRKWNPIFYGELPYTLGYATSGALMSIVAIDRFSNLHEIISSQSLLKAQERVKLMKIFYNLAFFFELMEVKSNRTTTIHLMPFVPQTNGKRTLELVDAGMRRTYVKSAPDSDRMVDIYLTLKKINDKASGKNHLQIVSELKIKKTKFEVILTPLGFEKKPSTVEEAREWIVGMLTALSFWHGSNYCHGDIRWRNIVFVPTEAATGYWMLIDMDESYPPNTRKIDWNHQRTGETLTYQHDLYQLGKLLGSFVFVLPKELEDLRKALLASVGTETTAQDLLALL